MNEVKSLMYSLSKFNRDSEEVKSNLSKLLGVEVVSGVEIGTIITDSSLLKLLNSLCEDVLAFKYGATLGVALIDVDSLDVYLGFSELQGDIDESGVEARRNLYNVSDLLVLDLYLDGTFDISYYDIRYRLKFGNSAEYFRGQIGHVISMTENIIDWDAYLSEYPDNPIDNYNDKLKSLSNIIDTRASLLCGDVVLYDGIGWESYEDILGRPYIHEEDFSLSLLSDLEFYTHVVDQSNEELSYRLRHYIESLSDLVNGREFTSIAYNGVEVISALDLPLVVLSMYDDVIVDSSIDITIELSKLLPDYVSLSGSTFRRARRVGATGLYSDGSLSRERAVKKFVNAMRTLSLSPMRLHIKFRE